MKGLNKGSAPRGASSAKQFDAGGEKAEALRRALGEAQQLQQEMSALLEGSRAILKYREFKEAARELFDSCKQLIQATAGYVAMKNEDGTENDLLFLDSGGQVCRVDPSLSMPIRGLREKVYQTGQVEYDNDFANSEWVRFLPAGHASLDSVLFAPLLLDGQAVGLLGLANKPGGFTPNDARLAAGFAELAAIALLNSRLLQALGQSRQNLEVQVQERTADLLKANESLRESEAQYRTLVKNIPQKIFTKDRTSVYVSCNESFARDFGITPEEFKGKDDYVFFPKALADKHRADDQRIMESGEAEAIDEQYLIDGRVSWVHTIKTPLRDEEGKIVGLLGIFSDITDRKLVAKALREREERYRSLTEAIGQSHIGLFLVDADYRVRFMNQPLIDAFGEQTGNICYQGVGRADSPCGYCQLPEVIQQRKPVNYQPTTAIGQTFDIVAVPFQDTDGAPCKLEIMQDITERRQAEESLRQSELRHRRFYESGLLGVIYWNMRGQITDANDKFLEMVGYTREDLAAGRVDWLHMTPPEFRYLDDRSVAELKATGVNRTPFEKEYLHKDGTRIPIILAGAMLDDERDSGVAFVLDITERKRAEKALQVSEERYRTVADFTYDWEYWVQPDGSFIYVSPAVERITGYPAEMFQQDRGLLLAITHPDDREMLAHHLQQGKDHQEAHQEIAFRVTTRSGEERWIGHVCVPVCGSDGKSLGRRGSNRDITEHKRAEAEHRQLEQQYRQAQKMEAVGRLAGGVAHDFNNMLSIILGYADFALQKLNPTDPLHGDIHEIAQAARRSADLTRQLLAFARKQEIMPRVVDLNALVGQSEKMLRRLLGEDIQFSFFPEADLWTVKMDPSQVDQLLANLAVNSRDAIPGTGRMVIQTANTFLDQDFCAHHPGSTPGEYVLIAFSDNGCGMDPPTLERIFEPFFTTKGEGRGTGLGLSTVYGILKQNNGFIEVDSQVDLGTTFKLYFPRFAKQAEAPAEISVEQPLQGTETILVVEDEEPILRLCRRFLETSGYKVITATKPGEAIVFTEKHPGEIHLLLTDVIMPAMNGKELRARIEALKPGIRVVFMSGYTADVIAHLGVLDEGETFIHKPFSPDDLLRKVRKVLDQPC